MVTFCAHILHVQGIFVVWLCKRAVQISGVSFTFSVTDTKHVLLICCDIFSFMFLILNNIWKFKMEFPSLGISNHASNSL